MFLFGSGILHVQRTDVANAPALNIGLIQNLSIDEAADVKELRGQFQRPVAIARSNVKTTLKASVARISMMVLGHIFYGVAPVVGQQSSAFGEAGTIPAAGPYTVIAAQGAQVKRDWGVYFVSTGLPLTRVAAAPAAGQYMVDLTTGTYTFAAADTGKAVLLNYGYTVAATGLNIPITNQLAGFTPTFGLKFYTTFQGQSMSAEFLNCTASKFTFDPKLEDFTTPDFEASCFADAAGNVGSWSATEVS